MSNTSRKIVVIGAGSLYFGSPAVWAMNHLPGLKGSTLSLVDTDPDNLRRMEKFAAVVAKDTGSGTRVEATADYREALKGADFVILSFSRNNAHYRRIDCEISARYGIRMCSGDTIGPGGVFRTMRELPEILRIAKAVEEICPDAWLINYVNPSAIMGIALARHSSAKTFALCDSHHLPNRKLTFMRMINIPDEDIAEFDVRIAGVNHFTWMLSANYKGKDILPQLREAFRQLSPADKDQGYAKARFNNFITAQLTDVFGALPTCTGHTKEYLPYYQGHAAIREPIPPLSVFDCDQREQRTADKWQLLEDYTNGAKPLADFYKNGHSDHATDIIQTMITGDGRNYFINRTNTDCTTGGSPVGNLPADAFLELECELDGNGPRPIPVGNFPFGLRALQMLILDAHELTVEAIVNQDRDLLVRALAIDPLVNSIATAKAVIDDLFAAQSDALGNWPPAKPDPFANLQKSNADPNSAAVLY